MEISKERRKLITEYQSVSEKIRRYGLYIEIDLKKISNSNYSKEEIEVLVDNIKNLNNAQTNLAVEKDLLAHQITSLVKMEDNSRFFDLKREIEQESVNRLKNHFNKEKDCDCEGLDERR